MSLRVLAASLKNAGCRRSCGSPLVAVAARSKNIVLSKFLARSSLPHQRGEGKRRFAFPERRHRVSLYRSSVVPNGTTLARLRAVRLQLRRETQ